MLGIRMLGELEVLRDGERVPLPPSRKTRALLAYLVATRRPHRRERLCSLLWDIPDDPRGALRWSLSRLRPLVDSPHASRIAATRETVAFEPFDANIDLAIVRKAHAAGVSTHSIDELAGAAALFRGEFLEGIDLPDLHDFQAWCLAEREDVRRVQSEILASLLRHLAHDPETSLPHARRLVQIDPFNEQARVDLLQVLVKLGRQTEAEQHYESSSRVLKEVGDGSGHALVRAWQTIRSRPAAEPPKVPGPPSAGATANAMPAAASPPGADDIPMIGRDAEWSRVHGLLDQVREGARGNVAMIAGEPGIGKSRLVEEIVRECTRRGYRVFHGRAFETDRGHPYGAWIEALGGLPPMPADGDAIPVPATGNSPIHARERLFSAVLDMLIGQTDNPVVLIIDDVQWCDEASADLLHYVLRANRAHPHLVVLAARDGELGDNAPMLAVLRALRHARRLEEIRLAPLPGDTIAEVAKSVAPTIDVARVVEQAGGNPLYAIELARNLAERPDDLPRPLKEIVRDRMARLPPDAAEVLTWASVLEPAFPLERLTGLVSMDVQRLSAALETLERHALLRASDAGANAGSYTFPHNLIHRAIYTGISDPRRRLMHLKIAKSLESAAAQDESLAVVVSHHAALGGDPAAAALACVRAGRRCLRLFANGDAEALAHRGLHYAEALPEPERIKRVIELTQIETLARRPADTAATMRRIEELAERALDHGALEQARLGFHMLSYLRWERGEWSNAQRDTLRAEIVSRPSDEKQRVVAMAETARCLAMLERDLGQAEALLLEARAVANRLGIEPNAISDASGMLRQHQGETDEAAASFALARAIARRDGDRSAEFLALEHLAMLELQRRRFSEVHTLCAEIGELAEKLREGSEAPFARALQALCRMTGGDPDGEIAFEGALNDLRVADAKHRLAVVLLTAADFDLANGRLDRALEYAEEALKLAGILDRPSEIVLARALLSHISAARSDLAAQAHHVDAMRPLMVRPISAHARATAEAAGGFAGHPDRVSMAP